VKHLLGGGKASTIGGGVSISKTLCELIRPSCVKHSLDPCLTVVTEDLLPLNPPAAVALVFAKVDEAESLRLVAATQ
jgi:hypothetical protein